MAGLDRLLIGRDRELGGEAILALRRRLLEQVEQAVGVRDLEIPRRHLLLIVEEDIAVSRSSIVELQVEHIVDALDVHRQPLEPVGQLARDRPALEPADLLEVSELRHFHAVAPHFPAEAPGAERRAFPIVLDEADVVLQRVDADRGQAAEIELLQVGRARLQHHLILVIMAEPVGVLAIAAVGRPAARLDIGRLPRIGPERAQHRRRVERPRPHLQVIGLQQHAALRAPIAVERQDQVLKAQGQGSALPLILRAWTVRGLWRMAAKRASVGSLLLVLAVQASYMPPSQKPVRDQRGAIHVEDDVPARTGPARPRDARRLRDDADGSHRRRAATRRCGKSRTRTRPSICSAPSTCCPRIMRGARRRSTRRSPARRA